MPPPPPEGLLTRLALSSAVVENEADTPVSIELSTALPAFAIGESCRVSPDLTFRNGVGIFNIMIIGRVIQTVIIGILGLPTVVSMIVHGVSYGMIGMIIVMTKTLIMVNFVLD